MSVLVYTTTLFVSAFLLFGIQPLFSKMVLPLFGGTPGTWNTCLVFYQTMLLMGYATSHGLIRYLGVKRQAAIHCFLFAIGFGFLPNPISSFSSFSFNDQPVLHLVGILILSIGWPFWVISATAPMLQRWFSETRHWQAGDPYFLYSASNLGSLTALLGYPLLIEPFTRLSQQVWFWNLGYTILFLLTFLSASILWRTPMPMPNPNPDEQNNVPPVRNSDRTRWVILSFIPSSLLLGVTTYLTTDLAAVPLLWVIPLALYLGTFILAFSHRNDTYHPFWLRFQPFFLAPPVILFIWGNKVPLLLGFPIHLGAFFINAMVCHGELAQRRPSPVHLTEFYFWMAVGGMAGGFFNAFLAPCLFDAPLEYPLAIACAAMIRIPQNNPIPHTRRYMVGLLIGLAILLCGLFTGDPVRIYHFGILALLWISSLFFAYCFAWFNRPIGLGILFAVFIFAGFQLNDSYRKVLYRDRSFFGPLLVRMDPQEKYVLFYHGTTLHGAQSRLPGEQRKPLTYFTLEGPFGQIMSAFHELHPAPSRIAITGLGAGNIAAYGRAGDTLDYFEIDPHVAQIARDTPYFSFLKDTPSTVSITLGDARLTLAKVPDQTYDVIIMDAFSSGSIPVHLVTLEAFRMVKSKLRPGGLLIYQISNRFLNLEPVLAGFAEEAGWKVLVNRHLNVSFAQRREMVDPSVWVIMAESSPVIDRLSQNSEWKTLPLTPQFRPWTDDFSNLFQVLKAPRWE